MNIFRFRPRRISTVVFDLCGTLIDKYSKSPVVAMKNVFGRNGIKVTDYDISKFMGKDKKEHIQSILNDIKLNKNLSFSPNKNLISKLYEEYKTEQIKILPLFCKPIEGVEETLNEIKETHPNIKFGVTTGFPRVILNSILSNISLPIDNYVASDDTSHPRPYPYMIWSNMLTLNSEHPLSVIKIGDTPIDIKEGLNAGVISLGLAGSSSYMGELIDGNLFNKLDESKLIKKARIHLAQERPHYILNDIRELPSMIEYFNSISGMGKDDFITNGGDSIYQK